MKKSAHCGNCYVEVNLPEKGNSMICHNCKEIQAYGDLLIMFQKTNPDDVLDNMNESAFCPSCTVMVDVSGMEENLKCPNCEKVSQIDNLIFKWCKYTKDFFDDEPNKLSKEELTDILLNNKALQGSRSSCFIATAALGDHNHPKVIELRKFRDEWILKKAWGKEFVQWYYVQGEKAAKVIENRIVLKRLSYYLIIYPLLLVSRFLKK